MDKKLQFIKARCKMQEEFMHTLSFRTIELEAGIKTEICVKDNQVIVSMGYAPRTNNPREDYLDSMLDAISNYNTEFVE